MHNHQVQIVGLVANSQKIKGFQCITQLHLIYNQQIKQKLHQLNKFITTIVTSDPTKPDFIFLQIKQKIQNHAIFQQHKNHIESEKQYIKNVRNFTSTEFEVKSNIKN
eukprot:EC097265.1.p2 GENE.EC097265.1~~EC097265.1.p2  ORF type:complete len:108 (-),score=6.55 EC097265.1:307-630(-)